MGRIEWIPIAELPEAFKDGREVLFSSPASLTSVGWYDDEIGWLYQGWNDKANPTHFAEINPP